MITKSLFPIPISFFKLDRNISDEENAFLLNLEQKPNKHNTRSTDHNVLDNPNLNLLREFIKISVATYLKEIYSPKNDISLRITQSWTNCTAPGQSHHKHTHSNSFISGVFYIKANIETDRIFFYKNDNYKQLDYIVDQWNPFNSNSWWYPVGTGALVLFPSSLAHSVEMIGGADTRISLSFNTFPVGHLGEDDSFTGLNLS